MSQHPLLSTPAVLIMSLVGIGAAVMVGAKHENNKFLATQEAEKIQFENDANLSLLNSVAKIEGRKITAVNDKFITLEGGKQIENVKGGRTDCQVGDVLVDYDEWKEEIVCARKNGSMTTYHRHYFPGFYSAYWRGKNPPSTALDIEKYKTDKQALKNNGLIYDVEARKYAAPNGTVFQADPNTPGKIIQNTDKVKTENKGTIKSLKGDGKSGNGGISTGKGSGAS